MGGGQITEKTESQCKVSGGDTVGGLIGKTQYVNSWRDASYTTCKLDRDKLGRNTVWMFSNHRL